MKMKKIFSYIIGMSLVFGFAPFAQAAFNDVTFSADTVVNLATQGINVTILSGSEVTAYTVGLDNISFSMQNGSTVVIRSADKKQLTNDSGFTVTCATSYSELVITSSSTQTVVVTPSTSTCSSSSSSGSSSGSGGGGSGGSGGANPPPVTPPVVPPVVGMHPLGTIINSNGTLYTITTNELNQTVRRPYTSGGAFLSYGFNSFALAVSASTEDLALPVGSFIPAQDGRVICSDRGTDKGTCYFMTQGQKAGFVSEAVFKGLGFSFSNVYQGDVSFMTSASNITSPTQQHLPGTVVNNGGTIQLIGSTGLAGFPTFDVFTGWGYDVSMVVPANTLDKTLSQSSVVPARTAGQVRLFY